MKRIGCYAAFVFAYALGAAAVVFFAELWGCVADSVFMKVIWFVCGFMFSGYLKDIVFPFLDEKFP